MRVFYLSVLLVLFFASNISQAHVFTGETVEAPVTVGSNTSLALDSNGHVGVCYQDTDNHILKYAFYDGSSWSKETADNDSGMGDNVGANCVIIFDDNDKPHIIYQNTTDGLLRHAKKLTTSWTYATIDNVLGGVSVAKDSLGNLGVAYYSTATNDLKYAYYSSGVWATQTVQSSGDVGLYASLDFDSANHPGIAYQEVIDGSSSLTKYVYYNGATWNTPETVDNNYLAGFFNALKFDSQDIPHLAYRVLNTSNNYKYFYYTNRRGGTWATPYNIDLDAGESGGYCKMVIDQDDNIHLIYQEYYRSGIFGNSNYLRFTSIYFNELGMSYMNVASSYLATATTSTDFTGESLAINNNGSQLYYSYTDNTGSLHTLYVGHVTTWRPDIKVTLPNNSDNDAVDSFNFTWLYFDPALTAYIRVLYFVDGYPTQIGSDVLASNGSYHFDTSEVPRDDYSLEVRISVDGFATYSTSTAPLSVGNHAPAVPAMSAPLDSATVQATPTLIFSSASDVDGDSVTYTIQLSDDAGFSNILAQESSLTASDGAVTWNIPSDLSDLATYYWRVRADDDQASDSAWTTRSFTINSEATPSVTPSPSPTPAVPTVSPVSTTAGGCSLITE